jgi:hypothetical protein
MLDDESKTLSDYGIPSVAHGGGLESSQAVALFERKRR